MTALFGKSYYESIIAWSESMLKLIENVQREEAK
jgi:hypothetical protein